MLYYISAVQSESEESSGGLEAVEASLFAPWDVEDEPNTPGPAASTPDSSPPSGHQYNDGDILREVSDKTVNLVVK